MATIKTAQFGNTNCPQAQFDVVESSSTGGAVTYAWTLKWVTHGYTVSSSASKAYSAKIDGATVTSGNFAIGGKTSTTIASGTKTISKGTSSRSISIELSFAMTFTWSGTSGGTKTASGSFTIPAKTSYTVSYNANGGSGAPGNQTKWFDTNITLSSSIPSRTGHNFVRWNTNTSNTGTAYSPGATYSGNANLTLYAIWTPHTYTVSYNANGGSGAPGNQTKTYGTNLTLSSTKPTRTNYNFLGWSTSASGGVVYAAGATYSNNSAVTLYAVWQLAYTKPRVTNFNAYRCDSNGNSSETGTYLRVKFNWATDRPMKYVNIDWKSQTASSWTVVGLSSAGGTSNSVDKIIGNGGVSIETSYYTRIYVEDEGGYTLTGNISIGTVKFPIDVRAGGKGVAIGKVAEADRFEVNMDTKFNSDTYLEKSSGDTYYYAERTDTGTKVSFGVGSGGTNHGVWSHKLNKWMMYGDGSNVYLQGRAETCGTADRAKKPQTYSSGSDSSGSAGWYLVASKNMNSDWEDVSATLLITQQYEHVSAGILRIKCRRNQNAAPYFQALTWLTRYGWNITDVCGVINGTTIQVYVYTSISQYGRIGVTVLEDAYRGGNGSLTLHNSSSPTTGLSPATWAWDNLLYYPVGIVLITATNTNPSGTYGGTWELIDKEFASGDNIGSISYNGSYVSNTSYDFSRAGHSLFFTGTFTTACQWNDDTLTIGTINFSSCGISRLGGTAKFVGYSDDGSSGLMMEIVYDSGKLNVCDNFGDSYVASGRNGVWSCTVTVPMQYMLDAACNKFYWRRTA